MPSMGLLLRQGQGREREDGGGKDGRGGQWERAGRERGREGKEREGSVSGSFSQIFPWSQPQLYVPSAPSNRLVFITAIER